MACAPKQILFSYFSPGQEEHSVLFLSRSDVEACNYGESWGMRFGALALSIRMPTHFSQRGNQCALTSTKKSSSSKSTKPCCQLLGVIVPLLDTREAENPAPGPFPCREAQHWVEEKEKPCSWISAYYSGADSSSARLASPGWQQRLASQTMKQPLSKAIEVNQVLYPSLPRLWSSRCTKDLPPPGYTRMQALPPPHLTSNFPFH